MVTVGDESKTFTYNKEFSTDEVENTKNSTTDVKEESVDSAESDAYYATNPGGNVGKEKTISGMSDFTEDMKVAT